MVKVAILSATTSELHFTIENLLFNDSQV